MIKVLNYLKYIGIFILFITGIAFVLSLINLAGINTNLVSKLAIILTILTFFIISLIAGKNTNNKGYILGIKLGLVFIVLMILINFLVFKSGFSLERIIYYIILIFSSVLGGSLGKNLKIKKAK